MPSWLKTILFVVIGIVCAVALFCLAVLIACSVNGLTFGEQVCEWFGNNSAVIEDTIEQVTMQSHLTLN